MTKETLMTQQTIDHFTASDSIGRANSNYTKVEEVAHLLADGCPWIGQSGTAVS